MIPITRKELYLNKIVGNNEYETPEKPISEEEFFFAEILGEAVQAPEPLPRYQIYLAKIAGKDVEIPYPETRLEYFLAKAAGMDIETPVPITREEIYWSNYTATTEFELEGVPPLTYKAIDGMLKNYRIYGDTVDGESVGDLVTSGEHAGEYKVPVTVEGKNLLQNTATSRTINGVTFTVNEDGSVTCNGTASNAAWFPVNRSFDLYAPEGRIVSIGNNGSMSTFYINISYVGNVTTSLNYSRTTHQNAYVQLVIAAGYTCDNLTFYLMIRKADIEDDTYQPYHAPVTTPIYLPEPIKMVGDEADYIDYAEQKMHRIGADDIDITLPELPTLEGTNVLTVGTEVQPSKVYIKGEKERE